jgi:hypothetical protein
MSKRILVTFEGRKLYLAAINKISALLDLDLA